MPDPELPDWQRALGEPVLAGSIKQLPGDFRVDELLGFEPDGDGAHDWLRVEKTGENTAWAARALARFAGVPIRDIGYSGLKDRQAVTTQWFSVPRSHKKPAIWSDFGERSLRILEISRHKKKLRRGAHRGNAFRIMIRGASAAADLDERLAAIDARGVPNYFGVQRFGRDGRNLELALEAFGGRRLKREQRSIALSAARSFLFNEVLSARVADRSWQTILPGECVNLDGSGSLFQCEFVDDAIIDRCRRLDIHPTGPLWGRGMLPSGGQVAALERRIAVEHSNLADGLQELGLEMDRRALRLNVSELNWAANDSGIELLFHLGKGGYATAVLRELIRS